MRLKALETMLALAEISEIRPLIMKAVEVNFADFKQLLGVGGKTKSYLVQLLCLYKEDW